MTYRMDALYSNKTLVQKLGIKEGQDVVIIGAPDGYLAALKLPYDVEIINLESNLDENKVMAVGLKNGLVDVKVISINETWSGLKFVYRLKDR